MLGRKTIGVTVAVAMSLVSAQATAKAIYKPAIPNAAVNDCDTCHIPDDPNDARNLFGQEVQILVDAATPLDQWWDQLKNLDSDVDGQTNAEELGDPCLEWTMAVPAGRTFDISNPGDAQSVSPSPDVCEDPPMMGEGGGGDGSGSGNGDGSEAGAHAPASAPAPLAVLQQLEDLNFGSPKQGGLIPRISALEAQEFGAPRQGNVKSRVQALRDHFTAVIGA